MENHMQLKLCESQKLDFKANRSISMMFVYTKASSAL